MNLPDAVRPTIQRCPTCDGHGLLPQGFFDHPAGSAFGATHTNHDTCRVCKGSGLVQVSGTAVFPAVSLNV